MSVDNESTDIATGAVLAQQDRPDFEQQNATAAQDPVVLAVIAAASELLRLENESGHWVPVGAYRGSPWFKHEQYPPRMCCFVVRFDGRGALDNLSHWRVLSWHLKAPTRDDFARMTETLKLGIVALVTPNGKGGLSVIEHKRSVPATIHREKKRIRDVPGRFLLACQVDRRPFAYGCSWTERKPGAN